MYNGPYDPRRWRVGHWIRLGILVVFAVFVAAMIYFLLVGAPTIPAGTAYPMVPFWGFGWIWILLGFFLFFGLLRFAFWGPRYWGGYYGRHGYFGGPNEAYHILRTRYARGEITKEQYEQMMRDLYAQPPPTPPRY